MHDHDIAVPSSRQSLAVVIVVLVMAGVIISRDGSPQQSMADSINIQQNQQIIEQVIPQTGEKETPVMGLDETEP